MKPRINLCVYNHSRTSVLDQIWFVREAFSQQGYELICTQTLRPDCLNFVVENFVEEDVERIEGFCLRFGKQIGVIMTEHVELQDGLLSFNGKPLQDMVYIGNKEQRLYSLLSLVDQVFGFFTLGELPELQSLGDILPSRRAYRIPYPSIQDVFRRSADPVYDMVFTGAATPHREAVLQRFAETYKLIRADAQRPEDERAQIYASAKVALNVPQSADWQWVSPMRVLFGLRAGTPTVHIGQRDATVFSQLVLEPVELEKAVREHDVLFKKQSGAYEELVRSEHNCRLPSGLLDVWGSLERLC